MKKHILADVITGVPGGRRSAPDALRHGLLVKCTVLPAGNEEASQNPFRQYLQRFGPVDGFEFGFLEEMAASFLPLRRAWAIEKTGMAEAIHSQPPGDQATRLTAVRRTSRSSAPKRDPN